MSLLFEHFPRQLFTSGIAREIARDEEFVKTLLLDLSKKEMVTLVNKNPKGAKYKKRQRWRMSTKAYEVYSQKVASK